MSRPAPNEWFLGFWGQAPYSQWCPAPFVLDGLEYACAEQWMMACKARHFKDGDAERQIMATANPAEHKALGRKVRNFDRAEWLRVAREYVYRGNLAKFSQNPAMCAELLATGDLTLVEAAPDDTIWGVGLAMPDPCCFDRRTWRGLNWLGLVLMRVRYDLRQELVAA